MVHKCLIKSTILAEIFSMPLFDIIGLGSFCEYPRPDVIDLSCIGICKLLLDSDFPRVKESVCNFNCVYLKQKGKAHFLDHLSPQEILLLNHPMLFDSF